MPLELRPSWCLTDAQIDEALVLGDWMTTTGRHALTSDGDDWRPGERITVTRDVTLKYEPIELRRHLNLIAGQTIGIAARWSCRAVPRLQGQDVGAALIPASRGAASVESQAS